MQRKRKKNQNQSKLMNLYFNRNYFSPFAKKAKEYNKYWTGGKKDDITVIVSHITNKDKFYYDSSTNTSLTDTNEKNDDFLI